MVPSAETGPLSEVVVPIFSSVAVTPGVACAKTARGDRAAAALPARIRRRWREVMSVSLGLI